MPSADQVRQAVEAFVDSFNRGDKQAFLAVLADDVEQEDPVGSPVNRGKEAAARFWDTLYASSSRIDFQARELYQSGDEAVLVLTIVQHRTDGTQLTLDGADTFRIDGDGKVAVVRAFLQPRAA